MMFGCSWLPLFSQTQAPRCAPKPQVRFTCVPRRICCLCCRADLRTRQTTRLSAPFEMRSVFSPHLRANGSRTVPEHFNATEVRQKLFHEAHGAILKRLVD